jgi:hypothetical protein
LAVAVASRPRDSEDDGTGGTGRGGGTRGDADAAGTASLDDGGEAVVNGPAAMMAGCAAAALDADEVYA